MKIIIIVLTIFLTYLIMHAKYLLHISNEKVLFQNKKDTFNIYFENSPNFKLPYSINKNNLHREIDTGIAVGNEVW